MSGDLGSAEVRLLGVLEVLAEGVRVELGTAKMRAVLAMLALHPGQVLSAERLVEGLWGDTSPATAANTLQSYISHLRKVLGRDAIVTRAPGYLLVLPAEAVDVGCFERLMTEGRAALDAGRAIDAETLLKSALALWRGPALDEFTYEPFAQVEVARLEELRLVAIEEFVEARLALGRHTELVGELRAVTQEHPLRERLWGQLMKALYRSGRQAEALRTFSELRGHLGEELGIEPSPELQRLEKAMLLQKPELDWPDSGGTPARTPGAATPRHNLPLPRSSFVGRDEEQRELEKLTTTSAIVTVVGPGGSGKSRLALEIARRLSPSHKGGIWLVELASVSDPALVPHAVATAIGVREEPGRPLAESLAEVLDGRTLLLLDNCEHLVEAAAGLVDTLVRAAPGLTVLATSREALRVDGEVLWRIRTLAVPETDSMPAEAMIEYDAVRLFVERASAQGNYMWGPASAAAVARVCRRLDGLPLAIELAAARTRALSPAVIAERLDDRFALLTAGVRTALPRQQTLRATVDWSYELLQPPERIMFRRLSVFSGGCGVSAAQEVCAGEDLAGADVLDLLAALADRSLATVSEHEGALRFSMHETLRAYAAERLAEAEEENALRARHLAWMLTFAEAQQNALAPELVTQKAALDCVELEHDNIRQALRSALAADPDAALRLVASVGEFWRMRGHLGEGRRWAEASLVAAPEGDMRLRALVLERVGSLALKQGDARYGQSLVEQSIAEFRKLGDLHAVAIGLEQLIWLAVEDSDWSRAEHLARQCMDIHTELGDEHLVAENVMALAWIKLRRGDESTAQQLMGEALIYNFKHADDPCPVLRARSGTIALLRGEFAHAKPRLAEAVRYNRDTRQPLSLCGDLGWLGEVAFLEGDVEEGERLFAEQLSIAREQGIWVWTRHALKWLAKVAIRRGDVASARVLLEEVQRMSRTREIATDPEELEAVAELLATEGRTEEAARLLGTAEALRELLGAPVPPAYRPGLDGITSKVASGLESEALAAVWAEGRYEASTYGRPLIASEGAPASDSGLVARSTPGSQA